MVLDSSYLDSNKMTELRKKVKELEDENEQLSMKLEKNNRHLHRLSIERE